MAGWLSFIIYLGLGLWLVSQYISLPGLSKKHVLFGFGIKLIFAIAYILVFQFYFSNGELYGDSATFFTDSKLISEIFFESPNDFLRLMFGLDPLSQESQELLNQTRIWSVGASSDWINDNRLILKVNAIIHFFSSGNVYIHALVFSGLSYLGIVMIFLSFHDYIHQKKLFWFAIIAFPNIAFWGTGLLKESIFIFAFGLLIYGIYLFKTHRLLAIVITLLGAYLLVVNKPYAGFIIIGFTGLYLMGHLFQYTKRSLIINSLFALIVITGIFTLSSKFNLTDKISYKQQDLNNLAKGGIAFITDSSFCAFPYSTLDHFERIGEDGIIVKTATEGQYKLFGQPTFYPFEILPSDKAYAVYLIYAPSNSYVEPVLINHSVTQLLKNTGAALMNVFIRPFPTDQGDQLKYLSFVSNLALILFLIFAIKNRRPLTPKCQYIVVSMIGASVLIALIIGWSVPIFGAIVRYKLPVDLLLIILGFILLRPKLFNHDKY